MFVSGWSLIGLIVVGAAWVVVTGFLARSRLETVDTGVTRLRAAVLAGDVRRAEALSREIRDDATEAHTLTTGPAWWVASNLPGLRAPLQTTRVITAQADHVAGALPAIVDIRRTLTAVERSKSTIDITAISRVQPELRSAASATRSAHSAVEGSSESWFEPVRSARGSFLAALSRLDGELSGADRAARVATTMLGADGTQRYFVGFMNEAESRGTGGIAGAYAIVTANRGRITFERFGSDDDFIGVRAKVKLGAEFTARYGTSDPTAVIQNSNLSPDFAYAAKIWAGLWQAKTGEQIDGAIAIDPTALS